MNRLINAVFLIVTAISVNAQNYKGTLSKVKEDGLHMILLQPEVRSAGAVNLEYFRIKDSQKNEVSYTFLKPDPKQSVNFLPFTIISNESLPDSLTSVVVENKNGVQLNNLALTFANTSISKQYAISGSYDNKRWFGLVNNQTVYNLFDTNTTHVEKVFSFPLNKYKYLKFDFIDKKSLPVNVLKAGLYQNELSTVTQLPVTDFEQRIVNDAQNKRTQIFITFKEPQIVNRIAFDIGTGYFLRNAEVRVERTVKRKRHRTYTYWESLASFQLNSAKSNTFDLETVFEKKFVIEIENQDNQPLDIKNISLSQDPLYVVANLKASEHYQVIIDSTLNQPNYDLVNLQLSDVKNRDLVGVDNFAKVTLKKTTKGEINFWQTRLFMWICIVFGVTIIGYFAVQLLKDLNKSEAQ